ncbi:MAG TPA: GDSL-type esterase/lipase family protein, partial [Candidatus Saccharimonadales bacterium]|nr:GDSL-type esterase/lipase family protein [Candidatus Saccharimonadales bacterium]
YAQGYAVKSAEYLARRYKVTYQNFGVSGSRVVDVLATQLPEAMALRPDIVLIGIGANDVTHLTDPTDINRDMRTIVDGLYAVNPNVKIIITGSPQMGSVPRFPQPAKWLATQRTTLVNKVMYKVAADKKLVVAPIAEKTGPVFAAHPELFAKDKFHPTTDGYKLWVKVINDALTDL